MVMKPGQPQKTAEQVDNQAIIDEIDAVRKHKITDEEMIFGLLAIILAFAFPIGGLLVGLIGWQRGEKFEMYYNKTSKQKIASLIAIWMVLGQYILQFLSAFIGAM